MKQYISISFLLILVVFFSTFFVACESDPDLNESNITSDEYVAGDEISFGEGSYTVDSDYLVYVTKHGKKYHEEKCRYIKNSESKITEYTVSQALAKGYDSCGVCTPPEK